MPESSDDSTSDAFKEAFKHASPDANPGMPFGLPQVYFLTSPPSGLNAPPFSLPAAERIWEKLHFNRPISAASLTTFAACMGFMPTLQAAKPLPSKEGEGWMPERWRLEAAPEWLGRHELAGYVERKPEVLPRDWPDCQASGHPQCTPCPVCGVYFEPGDRVIGVPVVSHTASPAPRCDSPGCICHQNQPAEGAHLSTVIVHAHHLHEDESHHVPKPTPEQAREQKARMLIHERMKKQWRFWPVVKIVELLGWTLEYGASKGWWSATPNRKF